MLLQVEADLGLAAENVQLQSYYALVSIKPVCVWVGGIRLAMTAQGCGIPMGQDLIFVVGVRKSMHHRNIIILWYHTLLV